MTYALFLRNRYKFLIPVIIWYAILYTISHSIIVYPQFLDISAQYLYKIPLSSYNIQDMMYQFLWNFDTISLRISAYQSLILDQQRLNLTYVVMVEWLIIAAYASIIRYVAVITILMIAVSAYELTINDRIQTRDILSRINYKWSAIATLMYSKRWHTFAPILMYSIVIYALIIRRLATPELVWRSRKYSYIIRILVRCGRFASLGYGIYQLLVYHWISYIDEIENKKTTIALPWLMSAGIVCVAIWSWVIGWWWWILVAIAAVSVWVRYAQIHISFHQKTFFETNLNIK